MIQSEIYRRGHEQLKAGHFEEAKRLFLENEESSGTAAETKSLLQQAEKRMGEGDLGGAAKLYGQLLDRNPALAEAYHGLTRISLVTGQMEAASVHATAATRVGPELGLSWTLLGLVHEAQGDMAGALRHLGRGVELSPAVYLCQFNLGRALAAAGRPADGLGPLKKATELEPRNVDALYTLGIASKQSGLYEEAIRCFEQVTRLAPKNVDAWASLADMLFTVRQLQAARDALDQGLEACGDHPVLLEKALSTAMLLSDTQGDLALAYTKLGRRERALELARKIAHEAPADDPMTAEARRLESNLLEAAARS